MIAGTLMDAKYDRLFKDVISAGWCVKSDGHVESPQGYFAIVEIPANFAEFNDMVDAVDPEHEFGNEDWPEPGWYFTTENSDGIIRVFKMEKTGGFGAFKKFLSDFESWEEF